MAHPPHWEIRTDSEDRRGSARSCLFTLVNARGVDEPLWAWDIGLGGMQCRARNPQWPGTFLDLTFALPGSTEELEIGAQVLSLDRFDADHLSLGLKFCMLSARDQRLIYRFLDRRRSLWDEQLAERSDRARPDALGTGQQLAGLAAPGTLKNAELQHLAFVRNVNRERLPRLGDLTG